MADTNKIARQEDLQIIADEVIGHADISQIGDGTTRGGVLYLNTNKLDNKTTESNKGKTVVVDDSGNLGFSSIESYGSTQTQTQKTVLDGVEGNPNVEGTIAKKLVDVKEHLQQVSYDSNAGGENIWNEQWEQGSISQTNGTPNTTIQANTYRSASFCPCKPSTVYFLTKGFNVYWYDENKNFLSYVEKTTSTTTTSHANAKFFKIDNRNEGTYGNDVALIEGTSGTYKPYIKSVKQLTDEVLGINSSLGNCTNLLKPTLASYTVSGTSLVVTNNGDGSYTVNGTNGSERTSIIVIPDNLTTGAKFPIGKYKFVGCPKGGSSSTYYMTLINNGNIVGSSVWDYGEGKEFTCKDSTKGSGVFIRIEPNVTVNNVRFYPMVTTNLQATVSDYVQYTGSTGKLTSDVAEIKNNSLQFGNKEISQGEYNSFWSMPNGNYIIKGSYMQSFTDKPSDYVSGVCIAQIAIVGTDEKVIMLANAVGKLWLGYCYGGSSYSWVTIK